MENNEMPSWALQIQQKMDGLKKDFESLKGGKPDKEKEKNEKIKDDIARWASDRNGEAPPEKKGRKSKVEKDIEEWTNENK